MCAAGQGSRLQLALRTVLEWLCVPLLAIGLQLPQATLVYWLASSTFTLAQVTSSVSHTSHFPSHCHGQGQRMPFSEELHATLMVIGHRREPSTL